MQTEPASIIDQCFRGVLGRPAAEHELRHYLEMTADAAWVGKLLELLLQCDEYKSRGAEGREFVPPGHFYSVVPSFATRRAYEQLQPSLLTQRTIPGITLDTETCLTHLGRMAELAKDLPFPRSKQPDFRYYFDNPAYSYGDGLSLYRMIADFRPPRIIEVGSGYSSALMLDTLDHLGDTPCKVTFIEPYPQLLHSLLKEQDRDRTEVIPTPVQQVPLATFDQLRAGDILFIDSTHVGKLMSDVNYLYLEVLPRLARGVLVHIHDIFWPFDYPIGWVQEGRAWNEAYLLRALLANSPRYRITYFSDYMRLFHGDWIQQHAPIIAENSGGHVWLEIAGD